jgi:hypothetical protein
MFERIFTAAAGIAHSVAAWLAPLAAGTEAARDRWLRDPLSHPALDAMSLSELADLPPTALRSRRRE